MDGRHKFLDECAARKPLRRASATTCESASAFCCLPCDNHATTYMHMSRPKRPVRDIETSLALVCVLCVYVCCVCRRVVTSFVEVDVCLCVSTAPSSASGSSFRVVSCESGLPMPADLHFAPSLVAVTNHTEL